MRGRTTSPKREPVLRSIVKKQAPQSSDLKDLEAENMLSENWNSSSEEEDVPRERKRNSRRKDHSRTESVDTDSSCRTNNSSVVRFDLPPRELRMTCQPSGSDLSSSSGSEYEPEESQEHSDDSQDKEVQQVGRLAHPSWPHKNKSTTGIVTGLSPEIEGSMSRPHSSTGRYQRDPIVERYLHHNKSGSLALPSTGPSHRPHQRYYSYDKGRETTEDLSHGAIEALRSKSGSRAESRPGSRAGGTIRGSTTVGGSVDASSVYGDHEPTTADEHNYLAPLPPFQQGPAYSKVPKRKFCKFCFGGCRWWVLLLWIIIPAGVLGAVVAYLLHRLLICVAIDPNTVGPIVYAIDPASIQSLSLEYKTQTKGIINIVDSPNATETRVLLKLQRQFYKMKDRQDVTGFQIDTLANGTVRYVLNDVANNERVFYISSVLCSDSILTIEMPRTAPGQPELALDALVDQQDVNINLDETVIRNASWRFRGLSDRSLTVQSLNINALSISYTSTSPSTLTLASVIVRDRLSVVSVHGDIQAAVGFSSGSAASSSPFDPPPSPATVNLNTLDGQIQLDMNAWNQSCTFQVNSPSVELIKAGQVVLPFGQQGGPNSILNVTGLTATTGSNSVSGTYTPPAPAPAPAPAPPPAVADPSSVPGLPTASVVLSPTPTTTNGDKKSTATALGGPVPSGVVAIVSSQSDLGAGGSSVPAQFMLQANKNVVIRFP
ncbi:hypothetical protein BGX34_008082 [Mortierella sp. NVP85]|nr:hypothetical protein BGX34_008082 [Mortierella sp. NVP85]